MKYYVLNKEDKILVYVNKDVDVESTQEIWRNM